MNEKKTQNEILRTFGTKPEMRIWRANVGTAVPVSYVKKIERAVVMGDREEALELLRTMPVIQFGVKGQADLTGILPGGRRLEIEVKSETGRQRKEQKVFGDMINRKGGVYIVAKSVGDVSDAIEPLL